MASDNENNLNVIAQDDPLFTEHPHFDFEVLRREGLEHISELSGKIWTDHNAHDPGVTMLETLCYALVDLGYRTTLPMEDLLAEPRGSAESDVNTKPGTDTSAHKNFFTPHEILSCNPTTVLDFRKLLLNIAGVQNAWLEPVEYDLYSDPIVPNGLYRILIQKEAGWADEDDMLIIKPVFETLSAHRNLCEDFCDVTILKPVEIGVCADIEISGTADSAVVYEGILKACQTYITPEIHYYTLQELLDKGRDIEAIFAGRPLLLDTQGQLRNAGFIDTEELEALPFRTALYYSDLYSALLAVEGVLAVSKLSLQPDKDKSGSSGNVPCLKINAGYAAEFSLKHTCITLQTAQGRLSLDKESINQRLLNTGKPRYGAKYLDREITQGQYRPGLDDYYSIQHDFPLVYGIGDGGLPEDVPLLRKIQAMQLKGYLLFYDQLLANYLAQIVNLRHVFSLRAESERPEAEKHSYFSQELSNVPDLDKLLPNHPGRALNNGSILAVPVQDDEVLAKALAELPAYPLRALWVTDNCKGEEGEIPHLALANASQREAHIRQSVRDFHQGHYTIELADDRNGHLFILRPRQDCEWLLLSYQRYQSGDEARAAANFTAFMASRPEYYARKLQPVEFEAKQGKDEQSQKNKQLQYQYNLAYDPSAYSAYLQFLVEDEALYLQRREAFLDHLLARFASRFTDYALLRFGTEVAGVTEHRQTVEDKSRFLSQIDDLSRDRGRAYDYLKPSWATDNVSGFEKRVALLAGMQQSGRRYLSKFEVLERFRIEMKDLEGHPWFSSIETYASREELGLAQKDLLGKLADPLECQQLRKRMRGFDPGAAERMFSPVAGDENIAVSQYVYSLVLKNSDGVELLESNKKNYKQEHYVWLGLTRFIGEVKESLGMELEEVAPKTQLYFDSNQLQCRILPIITYKWHRYDEQGELSTSANTAYSDIASAISDFAETGDHKNIIVQETDASLWSLTPGEGLPSLLSSHAFDNHLDAQRAWLRCKSEGQNDKCYLPYAEAEGQETKIVLATESGFELASAVIPTDSITPDEYIQHCQAAFGEQASALEFPVLATAFRWRLSEANETSADEVTERVLLGSSFLYRDIPGALTGLLEALSAAKEAQNYFEAGAEDNPDYRILLKSAAGVFIATTPGYSDAAERKKNLKRVKGKLKQLPPPLEVREEPRLYHWEFYQTTDEQVVLASASGQVFDAETAAQADFEHTVQVIHNEQPDSPVAQQLYVVDPKQIEHKYKFIYCLNDVDGQAAPLLESEAGFGFDEAKAKYAEFVTALPHMTLEEREGISRVSGADASPAVVIDRTPASCEKVTCLLEYMRTQHDGSVVEEAQSKWIYRLLDRDNPIAQSRKRYPDGQKAKQAKQRLCCYNPCPLQSRQEVLRVICPEQHPEKYHYALFLGSKDQEEDETATLVSYFGYDNEKVAREAGEANWLELIAKASDRRNYGEGKLIDTTEEYAASTDSACDKFGGYRAVKPAVVKTDDAVALANGYPIRITYDKDENDKQTDQVIGFHFQGYDRNEGESLWRSTLDYKEVDQAVEAYQLFVTLLGNQDGCRIVCEDGCYRIHLLEILAESKEFAKEAKAWGEVEVREKPEQDPCDHSRLTGVRQFAEAATAEAAYVPVRDGDCYRFAVVGKGYRVAEHTCGYHTHSERDAALECFRCWVDSLKKKPDEADSLCHIVQEGAGQQTGITQSERYRFQLLYPDNAARLKGPLKICGCQDDEVSEEPESEPSFCGKRYIFESTTSYPDRETAKQAFNDFFNLLANQASYQPEEKSGLGPFSFSIVDRRQVLASHPYNHPDRSSAVRAEKRVRDCIRDEGMHLVEHILLRPPEGCECLLPACPDYDCELLWEEEADPETGKSASKHTYIPGADPYSFWATIVLPGWVERFRQEERRKVFRQMLYREVPALVGLNIVWLSPRQMHDFECVFKDWLNSRRYASALCDKRDDPFCGLVNCIKGLENDPACAEPDAGTTDCEDCLPEEKSGQVDDCIEDADKVDNLFWLTCDSDKKPADINTVRSAISKRRDRYKKNLAEINHEQAQQTESYKRIKHFLSCPPTAEAFTQIGAAMKNDLQPDNAEHSSALLAAFSHALWYLLDRFIQETPDRLAPEAKQILPPLLQDMKEKGLAADQLAEGWQGETLGTLFGDPAPKVVREYLALIRGS